LHGVLSLHTTLTACFDAQDVPCLIVFGCTCYIQGEIHIAANGGIGKADLKNGTCLGELNS
jgi:hypothetical protein